MNFRISLFNSVKVSSGILIGVLLNLQISLERINILATLSFCLNVLQFSSLTHILFSSFRISHFQAIVNIFFQNLICLQKVFLYKNVQKILFTASCKTCLLVSQLIIGFSAQMIMPFVNKDIFTFPFHCGCLSLFIFLHLFHWFPNHC